VVRAVDERAVLRHRPAHGDVVARPGEQWTWGPDDATDVVRGDALDFCLVVTQRRPLADTALQADGPLAQEWMGYAQAFAGPPTNTDLARVGR
jgi:hypothetical protein